MLYLNHKLFGAVAAAAVACSLALAVPAMAADTTAATAPATAPAPTKAKTQAQKDPVEAQIARLHDQLHITAAQAPQFDAVAQTMRDNRNAHDELVKDKRQNEATKTAVEDLQAYADIAQNHADGVKKLAAAFQTLYDSLSDDQKKAADEAFRAHKKRAMQRMQHMQKS